MNTEPKIVCLGGGVGTVQLIRGLKSITHNITVAVSMADDGGSAGRLRRLYSVPPPGDLINCIAALSNVDPIYDQLLTYRFKGDRWGSDDSLGGQKLGNLMLVALTQLEGDFNKALIKLQKLFNCYGVIYPATNENVSIWAKTVEGTIIKGEENIDLGKYEGKREIEEVHLDPKDCTAPEAVKKAISEADMIIAGPGDLYTTILPVLLVPDIQEELKKSSAKKIFIVNIANKPFETPHYKAHDFLEAIKRHLNFFPFTDVVVNNNTSLALPAEYQYTYVAFEQDSLTPYNTAIRTGDLVNASFPIYHDSDALAKVIKSLL